MINTVKLRSEDSNLNFLSPLKLFISILSITLLFIGCGQDINEGSYDFELYFEENPTTGVMKIESDFGSYIGSLQSFDLGKIELENLQITDSVLTAEFEKWGQIFKLNGNIIGDSIKGTLTGSNEPMVFNAKKQSADPVEIDRSHITYILPESSLDASESDIDHAGLIEELDREYA